MSEPIDDGFTGIDEQVVTDEAIQDFIDHGGQVPDPSYHTILEVWREILKPAHEEKSKKVTPQWANKIVAGYHGITFADMNDVRDLYFSKLLTLLAMLEAEIASDSDCLGYTTPEDDSEHNSGHYKNLLRDWQLQFLAWELEWDCLQADAEVEVAALSEVHKAIFGPQGVTQFLDNIKFQYTEEDQTDLVAALNELKDAE